MPVLTHFNRPSSSQLLQRVLEQPQLLASVRELSAPALVRLINHVGLEDAGELIALTSTQQLCDVFDAELWQAAEPGADESFQSERFALYLHLLLEAGDAFVVERLLALPRPLLTLAFHRLLLVIDIDALTVRFGSAGRFFDDNMDRVVRAIEEAQFEEWEEFRLISRDVNAFDDVWNALLALDREDHALVRSLMERCCDLDGELIEESGLYAVLNDEEVLENDLAAERADRRAAAGYVAPSDARAFLELARRDLEDESVHGRDAISRGYFRELVHVPVTHMVTTSTRDVGRLLAAVSDADLPDAQGLAAPSQTRRPTMMEKAMHALQERSSKLHTRRSEELGFLANVLIAGGRHDGRAYRPVEAIECALSVCSIGLSTEHLRGGARRTLSVAGAWRLLSDLPADRLFRVGVRTLKREVGDRARAKLCHPLAPRDALAIAALVEPEPWLAGSLASTDHLFIASPADVRRARRFLARPEFNAGRIAS